MCVGPFSKLGHWGPIAVICIIKLITFTTFYCTRMWWPPTGSLSGFLNICCFLIFSGLAFYNFLNAVIEGPGFLPLKWKPESPRDEQFLQYCEACDGFKAPRSHHCRKCARCVLKMDHHCPWINNCVGYANHAHFTLFLFFAVCGCFHSTVLLVISIYKGLNRRWYLLYRPSEPVMELTMMNLLFGVFSLGLSIGVVLAVGMLLQFQLRTILTNRTGIEEWICDKAKHRRRDKKDPPFIYPYDLGMKKNFLQVINWKCEPVGDGIHWPVLEGCDQYTLTVEQQRQKIIKRLHTRPYTVLKKFDGSWFPCRHGVCTLCRPPFSDEARIPLEVGQTVSVTRWKKYWLFGEVSTQGNKRIKGWFPSNCVVPVTFIEEEDTKQDDKQDDKKTN
ncbi:unnamed protein product [Bemisia tabaci]|uniref:Palmitoyltransferase n=1 Tax=Bemisia tabaci TaxID=7038 RepID=A0A9P0ANQ9_BEMTA|nr:unnamed protein product [Bemisia tabaci]